MTTRPREVIRYEGKKRVAVVRLASGGCILRFAIEPLAGQEPYSLKPTPEECEQLCPDGYEVKEFTSGFYAWQRGQRNFFGLEPHPSDKLVHWSRRQHNPNFARDIAALRAAWDRVHVDPEIAAAAELLAQWRINLKYSEDGETAAGEDL